jgi:hypothetical protein
MWIKSPQVDAADEAVRVAVTVALRTAVELRGLARGVGAPARDGYLHRGRCVAGPRSPGRAV